MTFYPAHAFRQPLSGGKSKIQAAELLLETFPCGGINNFPAIPFLPVEPFYILFYFKLF